MKKSFILACMCLFVSVAKAQFWIGGQISNVKSKSTYIDSDHVKTRSFKFLPEAGYVINDKWDVAVRMGVDYSYAKFSSESKKRRSAFVFEPYVRYKFYETGRLGFFIDGGVSVENGDFFYQGNYHKSDTMFGFGVRPGVKYDATDHLTFVASFGGLGLNHIDKETNVGFNVNSDALTFGAYYAF